jgi:preprotein translocase subunit YajC
MDNIWILARAEPDRPDFDVSTTRTTGEEEATTLVPDSEMPQTQTQKRGFEYPQFLLIGLMLVVFYFLLFRGPRKKQQAHKQMVQTLAKNDKVRTIGGIIGTVVDIKGDEITLKVDESSNTKIKVASSAIGKNLSKD